MTDADTRSATDANEPKAHPPRALVASAAAVALLGAVSFAAIALAGTSATVGSASSPQLKELVVVNVQGRTLYALSPETAHHLLCKSGECLKVWPPLTVPSRKTRLKAGAGVQGHLAILRRSDGRLQVTLRGLPLYRFSHDRAKGEANGQNIESFGGTWHAVTAAPSAAPTTPATPTPAPQPGAPPPAPTPTPTPGYGY